MENNIDMIIRNKMGKTTIKGMMLGKDNKKLMNKKESIPEITNNKNSLMSESKKKSLN
jgi:hypothetical protein